MINKEELEKDKQRLIKECEDFVKKYKGKFYYKRTFPSEDFSIELEFNALNHKISSLEEKVINKNVF